MSIRRSGAVTATVLCLAMVASGCAKREDTNTSGDKAQGKKADQVKVALVPGGAHPYFQPWKAAGAARPRPTSASAR